jgi:hypothetical protein
MAGQLSRPDIADDTQVHFKKGNWRVVNIIHVIIC